MLEPLCQTTLAGLLVKRRDIVSGLPEDFHDLVERDAVLSVRERRIEVGIQSPGSGKGVPLDSWNLNQSAYRIAGHAKMVFQCHLGRILYL